MSRLSGLIAFFVALAIALPVQAAKPAPRSPGVAVRDFAQQEFAEAVAWLCARYDLETPSLVANVGEANPTPATPAKVHVVAPSKVAAYAAAAAAEEDQPKARTGKTRKPLLWIGIGTAIVIGAVVAGAIIIPRTGDRGEYPGSLGTVRF